MDRAEIAAAFRHMGSICFRPEDFVRSGFADESEAVASLVEMRNGGEIEETLYEGLPRLVLTPLGASRLQLKIRGDGSGTWGWVEDDDSREWIDESAAIGLMLEHPDTRRDDVNAPIPTVFYGGIAQWWSPDGLPCPHCPPGRIPANSYCYYCDKWGLDPVSSGNLGELDED